MPMEASMPDEKIDQKRPAQAEREPKVEQQRHVDDTVDDSFPASDPPAWTTTGAKSVAARCDPDEPSGRSSEAGDKAGRDQGALGQASRFVEEAYETGRRYVRDAQQRFPGAARSIPQVRHAVARPVETYPLTALILAGAAGFGLAWFIYGSQSARGGRKLPAYGKRSQYGRRPSAMDRSERLREEERLASLSRAAGRVSSAQSSYSE
jgi:hypothetical protein